MSTYLTGRGRQWPVKAMTRIGWQGRAAFWPAHGVRARAGTPGLRHIAQRTADLAHGLVHVHDQRTGALLARYPNWPALVGFDSSYGSEQFNDHHFHYGYFTFASALLGMYDPTFLNTTNYGAIAKLVAKEYANWDRTDQNFPFLRTFDIWAGHSDAGGFSSPGGNNQESSSEAMQSWGGLFLLGQHDGR